MQNRIETCGLCGGKGRLENALKITECSHCRGACMIEIPHYLESEREYCVKVLWNFNNEDFVYDITLSRNTKCKIHRGLWINIMEYDRNGGIRLFTKYMINSDPQLEIDISTEIDLPTPIDVFIRLDVSSINSVQVLAALYDMLSVLDLTLVPFSPEGEPCQ